jgi:hypothetical protein
MGKRVCFVGACPNLVGTGYGKVIDSYDTVVRSNNSIALIESEKFCDDYGHRCHVLYINRQYYRETRPLPILEYKKKGVKYLCMKGISGRDERKWSFDINIRKLNRTISDIAETLPTATMGSILALDVLRLKPKEFHMCGIDFFASRKKAFEHDVYREYLPGYLTDKIREQGNRINVGKMADAHGFYENADFMKQLYDKYPAFTLPDYLEELLDKIVNREIDQGD